NVVQDVVSTFQIRIDERNTKNGKLRNARWLEHHFLMEEDDLQALVPYFDIQSATEWSYPLKWEFSLETGIDLNTTAWSNFLANSVNPVHEVRRIYMRPAQYRGYRAPADFTLDRGDGYAAMTRDGKPMLSIKAGQLLTDLFPCGFWYLVSADRL